MSEYTPTTEDVRQSYIREQSTDYEAYEVPAVIDGGTVDESQRGPAIRVKRDPEARRQAGPEFDRWHAEELRKARAAALREAAEECIGGPAGSVPISKWRLRALADQIERQ